MVEDHDIESMPAIVEGGPDRVRQRAGVRPIEKGDAPSRSMAYSSAVDARVVGRRDALHAIRAGSEDMKRFDRMEREVQRLTRPRGDERSDGSMTAEALDDAVQGPARGA